eukprot:TRINITY_DN3305_c0_g1_i2.p1 TRINITY_DN3305_c0_g1~~TRINITY_DN3305_c0_g1_i2.p1  ORF type:complete len:479 (+),score=123.81 TRINITY_DN3305_c0_g1_i2:140-1576(+)
MLKSLSSCTRMFSRAAAAVPLNQAIENSPVLKPFSQLPQAKARMTVLPNGLRVISRDEHSPLFSVDFITSSGAKFETSSTKCCSTVADALAHQIDISSHGNLDTRLDIDSMRYHIHVVKDHVENAIDSLAHVVKNQVDGSWDNSIVEKAKRTVIARNKKNEEEDHGTLIGMLSRECAFDGPMGNVMYCPTDDIMNVTSESIKEFLKGTMTADRSAIAATGIDHDMFVYLVQKSFGFLESGKGILNPPSVYKHKHTILEAPAKPRISVEEIPNFPFVSVMFQGPGWNINEIMPFQVLKSLIGGGSAFSAGGPGKGMHCRAYKHILQRHQFVDSCHFLGDIYKETGLFGFQASVYPGYENHMINVIGQEMYTLKDQPPTEEELQRSKNQFGSQYLQALELAEVESEDMARQALVWNTYYDQDTLMDCIDRVTLADIRNAVDILLCSEPTVVAYGNPKPDIYTEEQINGFFKQLSHMPFNV